jgi:transcriptional regulator with XRE-family HTH domain
MAHSVFIRNRAKELRRKGYSLKEISRNLGVAKSTAGIWVRDIKMSEAAETRLLSKIKLGQFISARNRRAKTKALEEKYFQEALEEIRLNPNHEKIVCAMLYWCEGGKTITNGVRFINSDPRVIATFLRLFRLSFDLDEKKFRVCVHLHEYHDEKRQLAFWSKVSQIKRSQFIKPFRKKHTGTRIHEDYPGCASIYYQSADTARRLLAIGKAFLMEYGMMGA